MWSTQRDRTKAEIQAQHEVDLIALRERVKLPMEERIRLWREEDGGEELEETTELLCLAEEEIRRLRDLVK